MKKYFLSLLLLLSSWPANSLSSYISAYAGFASHQVAENEWKPIKFELNGLSYKWNKKEDSVFSCAQKGTYVVFVSAQYSSIGCNDDALVKIRALVNGQWIWNTVTIGHKDDANIFSLSSHYLLELKKGDRITFEHMRTGAQGRISSMIDRGVPTIQVSIIRIG